MPAGLANNKLNMATKVRGRSPPRLTTSDLPSRTYVACCCCCCWLATQLAAAYEWQLQHAVSMCTLVSSCSVSCTCCPNLSPCIMARSSNSARPKAAPCSGRAGRLPGRCRLISSATSITCTRPAPCAVRSRRALYSCSPLSRCISHIDSCGLGGLGRVPCMQAPWCPFCCWCLRSRELPALGELAALLSSVVCPTRQSLSSSSPRSPHSSSAPLPVLLSASLFLFRFLFIYLFIYYLFIIVYLPWDCPSKLTDHALALTTRSSIFFFSIRFIITIFSSSSFYISSFIHPFIHSLFIYSLLFTTVGVPPRSSPTMLWP
mgnify:CR=1 FL=1